VNTGSSGWPIEKVILIRDQNWTVNMRLISAVQCLTWMRTQRAPRTNELGSSLKANWYVAAECQLKHRQRVRQTDLL
jgi:hypothetical protein